MNGARPPRLARLLLRLVPIGERRREVAADLREAFLRRAGSHGPRVARRGYRRDVVSLLADTPRRILFNRPRPSRWPADAAADLAYGVRVFRRQPGAVAVAVVGLALAIAIGTSVFSLVYAIALRPYGMTDPDRVYRVSRTYENGMSTSWAYGEFLRLRAATSVVDLAASFSDGVLIGASADEQRPSSQPVSFVSDNYLKMLGATAVHGRLFSAGDDAPGQPPAAVVSYTYWKRRFGGDPGIVGRTVWLSGTPSVVVGVAARGIAGPTDRPPAFWLPLSAYEAIYRVPGSFTAMSSEDVSVYARLPGDVTRERAQAQLQTVSTALALVPFGAAAGPTAGLLARLDPADDRLGDSDSGIVVAVFAVVLTVVALILLLACANVANLQLASASARRREFGMRLALGAGRGRLVRQLLTESLLLGAVAGVAGLLMLWWILPVFAALASAPESFDVSPDLRVYLFLAATAAAAGLGAGLMPARLAARADVISAAQGRALRGGVAERPSRLRSLLVGGQAAASILLLVLAALLTRAMVHIASVDLGFDAESLVILTSSFPREGDRHKKMVQRGYFDAAIARARAVPGVDAVTLTAYPPFGGMSESSELIIEGRPVVLYWNYVSPNFFDVAGMRLIRGRGFTAAETAERVAVISESTARALWPGAEAIGQTLDRVPGDAKGVRVIGVVADAITMRLTDSGGLMLYRPLTVEQLPAARVMVRATAPGTVLASLERALRTIEPDVRIEAYAVADGFSAQLQPPRAFAAMAAVVGAVALSLAVIGLFGVTSLLVGQRTREIGVRMAIGATIADVRRQMLRDSLRPVAIGLAIGLALALAGGQFMAAALYGVSGRDPLAIAAAVSVLGIAAFAAVAIPVQRVAQIDPARTLRAD